MNEYVIPTWLSDALPAMQPNGVVSYADGTFIYTSSKGEVSTFDSLIAAENFGRSKPDEGFIFDESLNTLGYTKFWKQSFLVPDEKPGLSTYVSSKNDEYTLEHLEEDFCDFLAVTAKEYANDPEDFMKAFLFVDKHPAFWVRTKKAPATLREDFWVTEGYCNNGLYANPYVSEKKGFVFYLEGGGHVPEYYTEHYGDDSLTVYSSSYEQSMIKFAKALRKNYNLDGSTALTVIDGESFGETIDEESLLLKAYARYEELQEQYAVDEDESEATS